MHADDLSQSESGERVILGTARRFAPVRASLVITILIATGAAMGLGMLTGAGHREVALGVVLFGLALLAGIIDWRLSIYGLLIYLPFSGIPIIATYPDTAVAVLAKDLLFVVPAYAGFFAAFAISKERMSNGRAPLFLMTALAALVIGHAFNPSLPNRIVGAIGVKVWLLYIPLYFLGYHLLRRRDDLEHLLRVMTLAAVIPVLIGIAEGMLLSQGRADLAYGPYGDAAAAVTQNFAQFSLEGGGTLRRVPSTFSFVAQYFAFLISMTAVAYAWWRGFAAKGGKSVIGAVAWFLIVLAAMLSGARAAFLFVPLLIALILLIERAGTGGMKILWGRIAVLPAALFAAIALLGSTVGGILAYVTRLGIQHLQGVFVDGFRSAFKITLVGLGTGIDTNASRYAFERADLFPAVDGVWYESWWVKCVLELGIPGLVVAVALLGALVRQGLQQHRELSDPSLRTVSASLLGFLVWNLVFNMKGQYMDLDPINVYFWLFAGVLSRIPELEATGPAASGAKPEANPSFAAIGGRAHVR